MQEHYLKRELFEKLKAEPEVFHWIEDGSLDGLWYWDLESETDEWLSPRFCETFGYEYGEIPHTTEWWQANIFPEDLNLVFDNFNKHLEDPSHPYDQIVRYKHKNGSTVWIRCRGLIIRDKKDKAIRMLGAHTDVTPLMNAQLKLEKKSEELERVSEVVKLILKSSNIGIWTWDLRHTKKIEWNPEMHGIYELAHGSFSGEYRDWVSFIHPQDKSGTEKLLNTALEHDSKFDIEYRIITPSGETKYIHAIADVIRDQQGNPIRVLGSNMDITKDRLKAKELERSNQELASFAYTASHDLRSPLRAIKDLSRWIEEDLAEVPDEVQENIKTMRQRVERMEMLVEDLLEYSRAGNTSESIQLLDLSKEVKGLFESLSKPSGFELIIKGQLPNLETFKSPLLQIFNNLISNAIKHRVSDLGSVEIDVIEHSSKYEFIVSDDGIGIDNRYREKIFDMFQTLKPRDEIEASGMGLAIVKKITAHFGETVWLAEGARSHGASFHFTWPKKI